MRLGQQFPSRRLCIFVGTIVLSIVIAIPITLVYVFHSPSNSKSSDDQLVKDTPIFEEHTPGNLNDRKGNSLHSDVDFHASTTDDWEVACAGVDWWEVAAEGEILEECLNALDHLYLEEEAGQFAFNVSFGQPITFGRIFANPENDRNRVIDALQLAQCWEETQEWNSLEKTRLCYTDSFVSYSIFLFLCEEKELETFASARQDHWIRAKCQNLESSNEALEFSKVISGTPFFKLLDQLYGRDETYPTYTLLHLLAVFLGDPTALGLPVNAWLLSEKHPWRLSLTIMAYQQHDKLPGQLSSAYGDISNIQSLRMALNVAVGLRELEVEPNWQNLLQMSQLLAKSSEDSLQDAFIELGSSLNPIDDREELLALDSLEQVALELGTYAD